MVGLPAITLLCSQSPRAPPGELAGAGSRLRSASAAVQSFWKRAGAKGRAAIESRALLAGPGQVSIWAGRTGSFRMRMECLLQKETAQCPSAVAALTHVVSCFTESLCTAGAAAAAATMGGYARPGAECAGAEGLVRAGKPRQVGDS